MIILRMINQDPRLTWISQKLVYNLGNISLRDVVCLSLNFEINSDVEGLPT